MEAVTIEDRPEPGRQTGAVAQALGRWDGLLEHMPIAVYCCDPEGVVVRYNRRAAELWGRSPLPGDTH